MAPHADTTPRRRPTEAAAATAAADDDHIASAGAHTPPPPGAATPRPDLHSDKRLPQLSNFFAQVRLPAFLAPRPSATATAAAASFSSPPLPHPPSAPSSPVLSTMPDSTRNPGYTSAPSPPSPTEHHHHHHHHHTYPQQQTSAIPNAAPATPPTPDQPSRGTSSDMAATTTSQMQEQGTYPTPPLSSSSSTTKLVEAGAGETSRSASSRSPRPSHGAATRSPPPPSRLRTNNLTSSISTTGLTASSATAELSNPAISNPASPTVPFASAIASSHTQPHPSRHPSRHSSTASAKRKRSLTKDPSAQNTPPHTPRALSSESRVGQHDGKLGAAAEASRSSSAHSASGPVNQVRGELHISIVSGHGLKPCIAPYVVCIFQLNEDISADAKAESMDTRPDPHPEEDLARGVAMRRIGSDQGRPLTIPGLRSRQSSQTNIAQLRANAAKDERLTDPIWNHSATFDVVGDQSELDICIYDKGNNDAFLGQVRWQPDIESYQRQHTGWYKLRSREGEPDHVTGEIKLVFSYRHHDRKKVFGPDDFDILKLIGKGTFGQVFQVRKNDNRRIYAMKVLSKKVIVQKKEVQHTIGERNILVRTATTNSPFIVGLKFSFQTASDLYLVTDYMSGGELFWHLQREGRFLEDRSKFYIAELILALRHLHQHDIVYRDLKPENILLDANGHIALCDFGLSKANLSKGDTTNTFCGTTEYLAPEVLLDEQGYTKMVDFWSLGVLVFEMCCGWSPFYAEDTQQMYKNIAFGKVRFPRDALSVEGRNFVKGLLNRNPNHRLGAKGDADELMAHPFFADVDWDALGRKSVVPPFKPKLKSETDTSNFDPEFTNALANGNASSLNARAAALAAGINPETPLSPTLQTAFKGFTFVDESALERQFGNTMSRVSTRGEDDNDLRRTTSKDDRMTGVESNEPDNMFADDMLDG